MRGVFITIEGVEGCGKTTQVEKLRAYFEGKGVAAEVAREPGGTRIGEAVRALLLDPEHAGLSATAELLLYEAARAQLVEERIGPWLAAGKVVVCDRFADSTTAYQGAGRGLDPETVAKLHAVATRGAWPDLTLVIDVPVEVGFARMAGRRGRDRLEQESMAFHERVREGFLRCAARDPGRVKLIEGQGPVDEVAAEIRSHVDALLRERGLSGD